MPLLRSVSSSFFPTRAGIAGALVAALAAIAPMAPPAFAQTPPSPRAAAPLPLTTTAQLLAGVMPQGKFAANPVVADIVGGAAWRAHRAAARAGARQLRIRLAHMHAWEARHLPRTRGTLLYPFSGPDLINAYALFPDADTYVFFSLEPVGTVPALGSLDDIGRATLFHDLRAALNDFVALNFFITPDMAEKLQTDSLDGTVPILMAMMGVLNLHVDSVRPYDPFSGEAGAHPAHPVRGVRIAFTNPRNGHHQTLIYLAINVGDHALRHRHPGFLPWLRTFRNPTVLIKSASYLLHEPHFRLLRAELLSRSRVIVQDDSGIPYRMLKKAGYAVTLFGHYQEPVKLFHNYSQPDLEDAYTSAGALPPLPFPFGYNWRKEGGSGLILAVRKAP